jgi:hypothetical protein
MKHGLQVYPGGWAGGLAVNASQADSIENLRQQVKALADQIAELWKLAKAAGLVKGEPAANVVADDDAYVMLIAPTAGAPGVMGHINVNARPGDVHLSANGDGTLDAGGDTYIRLIPPLPSPS